jgi:D-sedoheptulose 7-phosphate isomerase
MSNLAEKYYENLCALIRSIQVSNQDGQEMNFHQGIEWTCNLILAQAKEGRKLIFIGNGGSAAISSHLATDFWKMGGIKALAFNDSSLLTCISNDYGYEHVFAKPISMFADPGDILMAISSSGRSPNILNGVKAAREKNCQVITFSGFHPHSPLRSLGNLNYYVPVEAYGPVEVLHHSICHCILDILQSIRHYEKLE